MQIVFRDTDERMSGRRRFLKTVGATVSVAAAGCTNAEDPDSSGGTTTPTDDDSTAGGSEFPERDVELVIPFGPGGGYDAYVRLIAPYLEENLPGDVGVRVRNVEGAGGIIATEEVYGADPDGYTNMILNAHDFTLTQHTEDVNFDVREFTYYAQVARDIWEVGVGTNTEIETWDQYVSAVQNEDVRFYHSGGVSLNTLTPMVIGEFSGLYPATNVTDNIVTYDGRGAGIQGILGGDLEAMGGSRSAMAPYTESGDIRAIIAATLEDEPPETIPDAETLETAEVENRETIANALPHGRMFVGPPDVPERRAEILRDAFESAIKDEEFLAAAEEADRQITYADAETARQRVVNMYDEWGEYRDLLELLSQ